MAKASKCPGCKNEFPAGRSYSQHVNSCKLLNIATAKLLRKHKITLAKKAEEKKIEIARHKELKLAVQDPQNAPGPLEETNDMEIVPPDFVAPPAKSPSPPPVRASGRPGRHIRKPLCYCDIMLANPPMISVPVPDPEEIDGHGKNILTLPELPPASGDSLFCTEINSFGVYRKYAHGAPTITPDEYFTT